MDNLIFLGSETYPIINKEITETTYSDYANVLQTTVYRVEDRQFGGSADYKVA